MMNLADVVKANECISLYKPFRSEDMLVTTDTCKKTNNLFIKSFCIRSLTMVSFVYTKVRGFLVSRKVKHSYIFFKCMSIENNYVNICAMFYVPFIWVCLNKRKQ